MGNAGFRFRFWCRTCENDELGCWEGGPSDWSEDTYPTETEAKEAGYRCADGAPWDVEVGTATGEPLP